MADTALLIQGVSTLVHQKEQLDAENALLRQTIEGLQEDKESLNELVIRTDAARKDVQFQLNTLQASWQSLQDDRKRLTEANQDLEKRLLQYRQTVENLITENSNALVHRLRVILPEGSGQALLLTNIRHNQDAANAVNAGNVLF